MTLPKTSKLYAAILAVSLIAPSITMDASAQESSGQTCVMLTDFNDRALNRYWQAVNDGVMGGRSSGGAEFTDDGRMRFSGNINTNGGGFSSVRANLSRGRLLGYERIKLRARSDGRAYNLTFRGQGNWRLTYRGDLSGLKTGEYSEVEINFADLVPSYFGRPVDAPGFDPSRARSIGIILSDGKDGPFSLDVDWVKLCGEGLG